MKCIICGTTFSYQTYLDPPETCDCGRELSELAAKDYDSCDISRMRDEWETEQELENPGE